MDLKQIANDEKYITAVAVFIEENTIPGNIWDEWNREESEDVARQLLQKLADMSIPTPP